MLHNDRSTTVPLDFNMENFASVAQHFDAYSEANDKQADTLRKEFLERFPAANLPSMTLQQYALGLEPKENSFCYWLEFKTDELGRIRGGFATKHIVFFKKEEKKWVFDKKKYSDENAAFEAVRKGLIELVKLAGEEKYDQLESVVPFEHQHLTRGKILFLYFADKFLPIYSPDHLKDLCNQFGITANLNSQVSMNRALLQFKQSQAEVRNWSNLKFAKLMYTEFSPKAQFWKVAPGEKARYWKDCERGNYICMGFDDVGDVRQYADEDSFKAAFLEHYPGTKGKWHELWSFANEIEEGDTVVANNGVTSIVGIGKSTGIYNYDDSRDEFKNCLGVNWEDKQERAIPDSAHEMVSQWPLRTVKKIDREIVEALRQGALIDTGVEDTDHTSPMVSGKYSEICKRTYLPEAFFKDCERLLETKKQIVLQVT